MSSYEVPSPILNTAFEEPSRHWYLHNGEPHDYVPDFIIRLKSDGKRHLVLETKGYDPLESVKAAAAKRWVDAVNADGRFGH